MAAPPLPSDRPYARVLIVAKVDGWSVIIVAALGGLISLAQGGWLASAAAALVGVAGATELHGHRLLVRHDPIGMRWLVRAQLALLGVIWLYALLRWLTFDPAAAWAEFPAVVQAEIDRQLTAAGLLPELDRPLFLKVMNAVVCVLLVLLTGLYQGGMAMYYTLMRRKVTAALLATSISKFQRAQTSSHEKAQESTKGSP